MATLLSVPALELLPMDTALEPPEVELVPIDTAFALPEVELLPRAIPPLTLFTFALDPIAMAPNISP